MRRLKYWAAVAVVVWGGATPGQAGINSFVAAPTRFVPGQEVTLTWNVTAGDQIVIEPGVGAVSGATGSVKVIPSDGTTYSLVNATSGTSATARVEVQAASALRHRWSFNEASGMAVVDSEGGADGTIRGAGSSRIGAPSGGPNPGQVSLPGGPSATGAYIDLPNSLIGSFRDLTVEGWVTVNGASTNARLFDFGTGSIGEIAAPGGTATAIEYLALFSQVGSSQAQKRMILRDNNTDSRVDIADPTTAGAEFHFAVVYDADGNNNATPQLRYFKNGVPLGSVATNAQLANLIHVNNWLGRSNTTNDANLNGSYNEFRLWEGALTPAAIADSRAAGPDTLSLAPRIDHFAMYPATPTTIFSGTPIRLGWLVSNPEGAGALTVSLSGGVGALPAASGHVMVTPQETTTYQLTAANPSGSRTASVTITVIPAAPEAQALAVTVPHGTGASVTLVATDLDTPATSLQYAIVDPPAHGSLTGGGAARFYTPAPGFAGLDAFTYKASDGVNDSSLATVTLTVLPAPVAPTAIRFSETAVTTGLVGGSFAGRLQATDGNPDDRFTYALVAGPGAEDNASFSVIGNQLLAARSLSADAGRTLSVRLRVTDSSGRTWEQVVPVPVVAESPHVKITEIHYNPNRNTLLAEYIELHNPLATAVDLSGWRLAQGVEYTFPAGTTLAAGGYLVIGEDPATLQGLFGVTALGPWTGGLSSEGEEIEVRDAAGATVDRVDYGVTAPWPAPPNGDGPSLELIHPSLDNDTGSHWRASTATPRGGTYVAAGGTGWRFRRGVSEASTPIGAWRLPGFAEVVDPSDTRKNWESCDMPVGLFKRGSNVSSASLPEAGVTLKKQLTDMATYTGNTFNAAYRSLFLRKTFTTVGAIPKSLLLRVMHNDAAIVWLNGVEVGRFGFPPTSPAEPGFDYTAVYERGNDPWSELLLTNVDTLLRAGENVLAIQGWAKPPALRSEQEDTGVYNNWDFCLDASLGAPPERTGTPGARNSVFATTAAPAVRNIAHAPTTPKSWEPIVVTAKISDAQGVGSVQLQYQVCTAGNFIPATQPLTNAQILANPLQELPANPAFEAPANWTSVFMVDDGSVAGDVAGDGNFIARLPAQPHRALVRYRITAADLAGTSARVPAADDPRRNFAAFVYDTLPVYSRNNAVVAPDTLNSLPVYHWITRATDYSALLAYSGTNQFANNVDLNNLLARHFENFEGALVVGDQVIDHTLIRLRGGNSRYMGNGKRHFRFNFPSGTPLHAADEAGRPYPGPWEEMLFNKLFGNKGYYDWGLTYEVGAKLWSLAGSPMPESHHLHFRVIRHADENDAANGDFWGLYQALELPEGKNFLDARNLPKGNFYKMTDWQQNGEMDRRYLAPGAPAFGEDFDNIRYNIHQTTPQADLERYIDMPLWYRYNAVQEAIRHFDIFVEPTGRHRIKNLIWYFMPKAGTNGLGQLIYMPYDWDASFGPNWNNGWDFVHNALYDHYTIADSPTWQLPELNRSAQQIDHRNAIRELRDLVWYRDPATGRGPLDDIIDDAVAPISAFWPADRLRWPSTGAQGDHVGGAPFKAQDMKNFAFSGWTDTFNGDPTVPAGGRAVHLTSISDGRDTGQLPATPAISYAGAAGHPVDGLAFTSSAFADPQGASSFSAIQWRVGEVTDPAAPAYDSTAPRLYEAEAVWDSGPLPVFSATQTVPPAALRPGHAYRARVRHRDATGRWGHWSEPLPFITTASAYADILRASLMVSEFMYHPAAPSPAEAAAGFVENDFEFIELQNVSATLTLALASVRLTKGVDFDFAGSAITSLAPGARVLIVNNPTAFTLRYGAGQPVAGAWQEGDNLSNAGEQIKVSFGAGDGVQDFVFDDAAPWPTQADVGGWSLVLVSPQSAPDHAEAANWRASTSVGGTPGTTDSQSFADWAAANNVTDPHADTESDGLANVLEYAFGGTPTTNDSHRLPSLSIEPQSVNGTTEPYLILTVRRPLLADQAVATPEWSASLDPLSWAATGTLISTTQDPATATVTELWRAPTPVSAGPPLFGRVRVVVP